MYRELANHCKVLANPIRLRIITSLSQKELSNKQLVSKLKIGNSHLFQHTNVLTTKGIVKVRRDGKKVYYSLADKRILQAIDVMHQVFKRGLEENNRLLRQTRIFKSDLLH